MKKSLQKRNEAILDFKYYMRVFYNRERVRPKLHTSITINMMDIDSIPGDKEKGRHEHYQQ